MESQSFTKKLGYVDNTESKNQMNPYQFHCEVSTSIFHGKKITFLKLILSELETYQDLDSSKKFQTSDFYLEN